MTDEEIRRQILEKLSVKQAVAFRALCLGKRAGKAAVADGSIPVIEVPGEPVPSQWLREKLMLSEHA
jgi:hypothetical protein